MGTQTIPDWGEFYMANDQSAPQKHGMTKKEVVEERNNYRLQKS